MNSKKSHKVIIIIMIALVVDVIGFVIWGLTPQRPMPEAMAYLESSRNVSVEKSRWLAFIPKENKTNTGFIFYPGGRVDYRSYAPPAFKLAEEGLQVVLVPMPLNLAGWKPDKAWEIMQKYPGIKHWVIGGHSLGGSMAAKFAYENPGIVDGLILWASYPAKRNSLADTSLRVISIYGSRDGAVDKEMYDNSHKLLPDDAIFVEIEGGNHAQMGWYGPQHGDLDATIMREAQQQILVQRTWDFISSLFW